MISSVRFLRHDLPEDSWRNQEFAFLIWALRLNATGTFFQLRLAIVFEACDAETMSTVSQGNDLICFTFIIAARALDFLVTLLTFLCVVEREVA